MTGLPKIAHKFLIMIYIITKYKIKYKLSSFD